MSSDFKYAPLENSSQEFRLIQTLPGADSIQLTLEHYNFEEQSDYVALSYERKSEGHIKTISINGTDCQVRQNLWTPLQSLRTLQEEGGLFDEEKPKFWIDAICIRQDNARERGHQVGLMGQLYHRASHTIAWLGPAAASSDVAVRFLWRTSYNDSLTPSVSEFDSLEALCSHTYFQRLWIVQEVVLSRRLDFLCGTAICSWDNFVLFWKQLYYTKPFALFTDGEIRGIYKARTLKDVSKELIDTTREVTLGLMRQNPLAYLLRLSARRYCSDFHDRVYALSGLFSESRGSIDFEVDYSISCEVMIRTERFLNLDSGEYLKAAYAHYILKAFEPQIPVEILGKVAWYWRTSEVLHNLRINVFGSFELLNILSSFQNRTLMLQLICWIVSGYGIDLFSAAKNDDDKAPISYETSHLTYCWSDVTKNTRERKRIFNKSRAYHLGTRSYHIETSHLANEPCSLHIPEGFVATEQRSIKCRKLLRRSNLDVRIIENMQRQGAQITDEEATEVDSRTSGHFLEQVRWAIFSNLLARLFHEKFENNAEWLNRYMSLEGFVENRPPQNTNLGQVLSQSLFKRYRMTIVEERSMHNLRLSRGSMPIDSVKVVEEISHPVSETPIEKIWVASLICNE